MNRWSEKIRERALRIVFLLVFWYTSAVVIGGDGFIYIAAKKNPDLSIPFVWIPSSGSVFGAAYNFGRLGAQFRFIVIGIDRSGVRFLE